MKRFFVFLAGVLIMTAAWGQQNATPDSKVFVPENDLMTHGAMTRSVAIQDGQVWWNNYDPSEGTWGKRVEAGHYDLAAYLTYDLVGGKGSTVDGLNFWGFDKMSNVKIWVSTTLPTSCDQADLEVKTLSGIQYYFNNEMLFDKKHIIPESGLYVGFSFDLAETAAVITYTANRDNREGAFMFNGGSGWGQQEGCLTLRVLFGGDSFYQNAVSAMDFGSHRVMLNESVNVPVTFKNKGANTVSSIDYTITTSGTVSEEKHLNLLMGEFGSSTVNIPFDADAAAMENEKILTITKVNGIANTASDKTANGVLATMSFLPTAIPVIEEFTGTWCGYCPVGIAALNQIDDVYGDRVILIAVHGNQSYRYDQMEIDQYDFKNSLFSGYPSAIINRGEDIYPTYCINYLDDIIAASAPGEISVSAKWSNNAQTAINISTQTKFAMGASSSSYNIGFVLVADGLKSTEYVWAQSNNYSGATGYENDKYMYPFTQQPSTITGFEYNHVAVDGWGIQYGVDGSIPKSFSAGENLSYGYKADISSNTLIQDKSKLHVIALLLDKNTGKILNAAKTTIAPADDSTDVDIDTIVQCIMKGEYDANADVNGDEKVDVADIVFLVNMLK
jgi:thiol-disulfide isomerase/thioredoxin